mgnify:FL=1
MSTNYSQLQKILAIDGTTENFFGNSVALSMSGDVALVGATGNDGDTGSAYVFIFSDMQWVQQKKLIAGDAAINDLFGNAVALSADGKTALVGDHADTIGPNQFQGSAYVFVKTVSDWEQQIKLTGVLVSCKS